MFLSYFKKANLVIELQSTSEEREAAILLRDRKLELTQQELQLLREELRTAFESVRERDARLAEIRLTLEHTGQVQVESTVRIKTMFLPF